MEGLSIKLPLVAIVGPTASGKTSLAIRLEKEFRGEIICADSRTIYRGMDIGTAKPTPEEQALVPHWGLDLVNPGERFTVADFQKYALKKIDEIRARGRIPFLVGGTGLYVDSVMFAYEFPDTPVDAELKKELESMTIDGLQDYCNKNNINLPENKKNKRYLINSILRQGSQLKRRLTPISSSFIVGIATEKEVLLKRIADRSEQIFVDGVVEEAKHLGERYGWESEAFTGNIYPLVQSYLQGEHTLPEIKAKFRILDWRLAKRQLTWLKRNEHIHWLPLDEAYTYCARLLAEANNL